MGFFRGQVAVLADKRIRLLGELIRAMRVVKMYVWEGHFVQNLIIGNFQNIIFYIRKGKIRASELGFSDINIIGGYWIRQPRHNCAHPRSAQVKDGFEVLTFKIPIEQS